MVGFVRANNPVDEMTAFEWATEVQFRGSVHITEQLVSLSIDEEGVLSEHVVKRSKDLRLDLEKGWERLRQHAPADPVEAPESPRATSNHLTA